MKSTIYTKKDGSISTIKEDFPNGSFSIGADGMMKGSSFRSGSLTTFSDAAMQPKKIGIKFGDKTTYYNPNGKQFK